MINVIGLVKPSKHQYVLLFDDAGKKEALRQLGLWASNQELDFTWYDAAVLSPKIRKCDSNGDTAAGESQGGNYRNRPPQ